MNLTLLKLIGVGFLVLSLFLPQAAFSFEEEEDECPDCPKEEKRVKLDDVFVHAFGGGAVTYTPTSTIVDVDKYVKAGNVERIEDILMNIAGIDVMKSSGTPDPQAVILMRGFDDSRFIVAINGRPITGSTGGSNTAIDWSSITLADVEKVEIIRGGSSSQYEAAEGGVINLIMKEGTKRETLAPKITFTQDYSHVFDYSNPSSHSERITVDGGIGELTYFFNYGHKSSDGYLKNNQYRGDDYSARFTYLFPWQGMLSMSYKGTKYNRENPVVNDPNAINWPGVNLATLKPYDPDYPTVPPDADTIRGTGTSISCDHTVTTDGLMPKSYKDREVNNFDISYDQPIYNTTLKIYAYRTESEEKNYYVTKTGKQTSRDTDNMIEEHDGGGAKWSLNPWENNSLTIGYSFKRTQAADMPDIYKIHAGFFDDLWVISPKWTLATGVRFSHVRHATYPSVLGGGPKQRHYYREWFVLPKLALTYNIRPDSNLFASISKDYDIPGC